MRIYLFKVISQQIIFSGEARQTCMLYAKINGKKETAKRALAL